MNERNARDGDYAVIVKAAPDVDMADVNKNSRLQQDLELDSLDFLRLVGSVDTDTGVDIPARAATP